jgi:hypothetical protein
MFNVGAGRGGGDTHMPSQDIYKMGTSSYHHTWKSGYKNLPSDRTFLLICILQSMPVNRRAHMYSEVYLVGYILHIIYCHKYLDATFSSTLYISAKRHNKTSINQFHQSGGD